MASKIIAKKFYKAIKPALKSAPKKVKKITAAAARPNKKSTSEPKPKVKK